MKWWLSRNEFGNEGPLFHRDLIAETSDEIALQGGKLLERLSELRVVLPEGTLVVFSKRDGQRFGGQLAESLDPATVSLVIKMVQGSIVSLDTVRSVSPVVEYLSVDLIRLPSQTEVGVYEERNTL